MALCNASAVFQLAEAAHGEDREWYFVMDPPSSNSWKLHNAEDRKWNRQNGESTFFFLLILF